MPGLIDDTGAAFGFFPQLKPRRSGLLDVLPVTDSNKTIGMISDLLGQQSSNEAGSMLYGIDGLGLTPQEINKVIYHRQNLSNPYMSPEGPMTIYSTGIMIPEGENKGKFVSVPGYLGGGKVVTNEDELWNYWKKDINSGRWPIYNSAKELNDRDRYVHQVMDNDIEEIMKKRK